MTDKLPPNLLKLFAPRPPLSYYPPLDKDPQKRVGCIVTGMASLVSELKNYDPDYVPWKSLAEKRKEKAEIKRKKAEENLQKALAESAYKDTDGLKILGRRIIVDVERARTVKGWKPRRLGGRLGGRETRASHLSNNSFRDRGNQGRGYSRHNYNKRDDDKKRPHAMRSRSRSPRGYRDREDKQRGRDRSRDRAKRSRY
ncbi:hypothetical protein G6F57_004259 [Rhizopus arrhizus]|uniref:U1 small nuclear ribonucleoprotein of 70kDa N-terminal domain-containing protein n=1 Tax=Rhizopus oryzae TaxID=64495 RepID=A0A9P7BX65_RHIOR|nr:hypothetical protein G6F23_008337 [Rhizopus arrhizus]KAG1426968.1 hypothetical protein G6F58_001227 [Rhizopus delemar]KAG0767853.1 hypothetical protein G6F24_002430 [Rhizopus arrhizus]KAG0792794.1 hypothetical protein G6F21_004091 [Rhizopus arrhizus]KAG0818142.1 hypothetical protein G6F20_001810 [Rhizopus arrhizus]